jgi:hypothetical protein
MNDATGLARDLNNDGTIDILVSKGHLGDTRVHALNGKSGQLQWTFGDGLGPNSGTNGLNRHWLANVDNDPTTELLLYVPTNANGATIFAFDFAQGFGGEPLQWTAGGMTYGGANKFSVGDVTGDGQLNVVMSAASDLHIFNAANGALLAKTPNWYGEHPVIPYGIRLEPTNVDGDDALELAGIFGGANSFWGVWSVNKDGASEMLWKQSADSPVRLLPPVDLNGDGVSEIAASVFKTTWTTHIYNGQSGASAASITGYALTHVVTDLNGDGWKELIAQSASQETVAPFAGLQPLVWSGDDALSPAWSADFKSAAACARLDRNDDPVDELLVYRDVNDDGKRDALQVLVQAGKSTKVSATYAFPKGNDLSWKLSGDGLNPPGLGQQLVFASDGYLDILSADLQPMSPRYPTGGFNTPILVGALSSAGATSAFVRDSLGHVLQINGAQGSVTQAPPHSVLFGGSTQAQILALLDLDGNGDREALVHEEADGEHRYTLYEADLVTARWQYVPANATWGPETNAVGTGGDLNGDGVHDLYLMTMISGVRTGIPLSGADGAPLPWTWEPYQAGGGKGTAYSPALIRDFDGKGHADVLVSRFHDRLLGKKSLAQDTDYAPFHLFDGSTGATLHTLPSPLSPSRMIRVNLDNNPATEDLLITWWTGRGAFTIDTQQGGAMAMLWYSLSEGPIAKAMPMGLDLDGDGLDDLLHFDDAVGLIRAERGLDGAALWPGTGGVVSGQRQLAGGRAYKVRADGTWENANTGETASNPGTTNLSFRAVAVTDLTGDGQPNALFAGLDGWLYCLNLANGTLDWSFDFGFSIGHVIVADIDNDQLVDVLATVDDGYLYALGPQADVGQIAEVRDGLGDDVDEVAGPGDGFELDAFSANWDPPTAGGEAAAGYLVRLVTQQGALVVDWQDAGLQTEVTIQGYAALAPGAVYQVVVMPYGKSGSGAATKSDGFWLAKGFVPPDPPDADADVNTTPPDTDDDVGTISSGKPSVVAGLETRETGGCSAAAAPVPTPVGALGLLLLLLCFVARARRYS